MSARMQFPLSQRRHTNIAVVRYSKNGVKLEIACYKNKVVSYRSGAEERLDEVLQVERVFSNVSRGLIASEKDIQAVFGNDMSEQDAIQYILTHGELQVAQQERTAEVDVIFRDIAVIIAQKCINFKTNRPFPVPVIEQALKSIGAGVKLDQPVKKQALALIHQLIDSNIIPITRADMKLRCVATSAEALEKLEKWCVGKVTKFEKSIVTATTEGSNAENSLLITMQPHLFRDLEQFVKEQLPSGSALHMVETAVMEVGEGALTDAKMIHWANSGEAGMMDELGVHRVGSTECSSSQFDRPTDTESSRKKKGGACSVGTNDSDWDGKPAEKSGGRKPRKGAAKRNAKEASSYVDREDRAGHYHRIGEDGTVDLTARLQLLRLNPAEDFSGGSDGNDAGRKGKKGKRKKAANNNHPLPSAPAKSSKDDVNMNASGEDSDEELTGNRKQRKKGAKRRDAVETRDVGEDEDFDYGTD